MLEYTPKSNSIAKFRSADGATIGTGPFDPSYDWSTPESLSNPTTYNQRFSKRYGGVPFFDGSHSHSIVASEILVSVVSGLIPFALLNGWVPVSGTFSGIGTGDISARSLYDFAYTAPEMHNTDWLEKWKAQKLASDPFSPGIPKPATTILGLLEKHRVRNFPERSSPLRYSPEEREAAGFGGDDLLFWYDTMREVILANVAAGKVNLNAGPAEAGYSFVTMDLRTFLQVWGVRIQGVETVVEQMEEGPRGYIRTVDLIAELRTLIDKLEG